MIAATASTDKTSAEIIATFDLALVYSAFPNVRPPKRITMALPRPRTRRTSLAHRACAHRNASTVAVRFLIHCVKRSRVRWRSSA